MRGWSDRSLQAAVGGILRFGVAAAALIVACGGAIYLARHGAQTAALGRFQGEPEELRTAAGILRSALALSGRGLIQLGLLVLIATPVARVAFSILGFALERDRLYVAVTVLVLSFLLFSLLGGGRL
ncbi:MAG: DUF1634 domain-containing protein [Elusimicrobia bacterium]|nr:DUF1634 domain-containing protein [Elusimicrobiota bacterium]